MVSFQRNDSVPKKLNVKSDYSRERRGKLRERLKSSHRRLTRISGDQQVVADRSHHTCTSISTSRYKLSKMYMNSLWKRSSKHRRDCFRCFPARRVGLKVRCKGQLHRMDHTFVTVRRWGTKIRRFHRFSTKKGESTSDILFTATLCVTQDTIVRFATEENNVRGERGEKQIAHARRSASEWESVWHPPLHQPLRSRANNLWQRTCEVVTTSRPCR